MDIIRKLKILFNRNNIKISLEVSFGSYQKDCCQTTHTTDKRGYIGQTTAKTKQRNKQSVHRTNSTGQDFISNVAVKGWAADKNVFYIMEDIHVEGMSPLFDDQVIDCTAVSQIPLFKKAFK